MVLGGDEEMVLLAALSRFLKMHLACQPTVSCIPHRSTAKDSMAEALHLYWLRLARFWCRWAWRQREPKVDDTVGWTGGQRSNRVPADPNSFDNRRYDQIE